MAIRINGFLNTVQKASHMKREKIIDLTQELISLFDKEDVLAFFDFQLIVDRTETVQGLCKISKPKEGKPNYLSLMFIIDAIDDKIADRVNSVMKSVSWGEFKKHGHGIDMVIAMPHVKRDTQHYLEEIEIYLNPELRITKAYLTDDLYPAIVRTLGCTGGGLVLWDDLPTKRIDNPNKMKNHSMINLIIAYLKGE